MKHIRILLITLLGMMVLSTHAQILSRGVTKELVDHRKANISNVIYDLTFNIPADMNQKVTGSAVICFDLKKAEERRLRISSLTSRVSLMANARPSFPRIRKRLSSRRWLSRLPIRMSISSFRRIWW